VLGLVAQTSGFSAVILADVMRALKAYQRKRDFRETNEPKGQSRPTRLPIFVVQRHAASHLHFDFRLQVKGTLASWAVPKGPPEEIGEKRLAIHVEDHPIEYAKFEGDIPSGNYGAGHVDIWDEGTFGVEGPESAAAQIERGDLKFRLIGKRLNGRFVLVRMKNSKRGNEWLFIRKTRSDDPAADHAPHSGATIRQINAGVGENLIASPERLDGAKKTPMPADVSVALAQLSEDVFSDPEWLFEIKWDGERSLAFIRDGKVELRARSGRDITKEYPELKAVVKQLNARQAVLDGEIVVLDADGRSDFAQIQPRFGVNNPALALQQTNPVTYYLFDLLYCDGFDLRSVSLEKRKALLRTLLRPSENIRYSDHIAEKGAELFAIAKKTHLEGIIAKRRDSHYIGKRSSSWLKFKIVHDIDVVIGGWTTPRKTRDHFGALLMGLYDGKALKYIGSVGTGFDNSMLARTHKSLDDLAVAQAPFQTTPQLKETVHWVKPQLVARVKYGRWTNDKKLREPVFLGFQEDREARDCQIEKGTPSEKAAKNGAKVRADTPTQIPKIVAAHVASTGRVLANAHQLEKELSEGGSESLSAELEGKRLSLTHLNKVYFKKPSLRKRDVLLYYLRIAPYILPFLKDRPMVLKRYPDGIDGGFFFQKEAPKARPDWVKTVEIFSKERGGEMPYVLANDPASLLYLTNLGCIDHNPWSSRFDDEDRPDYIFFDLDPTDGTGFDVVLTVARAIHKQLQALKIRSFLKTSGASGFHIYVPVERKYTYKEAQLFAGAIGQRVRATLPEVVTFERSVSKRRRGTVLIDAIQNAKGKPLAAPYSLRPFPGAPVSAPVTEAELTRGLTPENLNVTTIFKRLKAPGDLWKSFWGAAQSLDEAVDKAT
jgi:bifunctional non-homologous end joining protein LigD